MKGQETKRTQTGACDDRHSAGVERGEVMPVRGAEECPWGQAWRWAAVLLVGGTGREEAGWEREAKTEADTWQVSEGVVRGRKPAV